MIISAAYQLILQMGYQSLGEEVPVRMQRASVCAIDQLYRVIWYALILKKICFWHHRNLRIEGPIFRACNSTFLWTSYLHLHIMVAFIYQIWLQESNEILTWRSSKQITCSKKWVIKLFKFQIRMAFLHKFFSFNSPKMLWLINWRAWDFR